MLCREADGAIGFDSTIFYKLREGGAILADIDITYYSDAGLDLHSNGIIVSRRMLEAHPDRIAGVVRACARGWRDALANPAEVIDILAEVLPSIDRRKEAERFAWIRTRQIVTPGIRRDGLGLVDPVRLDRILKQISAASGQKSSLRADQVISATYLPALSDCRVM